MNGYFEYQAQGRRNGRRAMDINVNLTRLDGDPSRFVADIFCSRNGNASTVAFSAVVNLFEHGGELRWTVRLVGPVVDGYSAELSPRRIEAFCRDWLPALMPGTLAGTHAVGCMPQLEALARAMVEEAILDNLGDIRREMHPRF